MVLNLYSLKTFPLNPTLFCIKKGLSFRLISKINETDNINGTININIPGRELINLNLVSKDNVKGLGPIDKIKSAIDSFASGFSS